MARPAQSPTGLLHYLDYLKELQMWGRWQKTTKRESMPHIFREFGIESGYRLVGRSWRYYFVSGFQLHNETLNIWTHLLGALLLLSESLKMHELASSGRMAPADDCVIKIYSAGAVTLHLASALAHLVHNHSEKVHCTAFYCDNAAVGFSCFGITLVQFLFCSRSEFYSCCSPVLLPVLFVMASGVGLSNSLGLALHRRQDNFAAKAFIFGATCPLFFLCWLPKLHKIARFALFFEHQLWQPYYTISKLFFMLGSACYAFHWPEKFAPGHFDVIGHSHQWWHTCFTVSCYCIFEGLRQDVLEDSPYLHSKRVDQFEPLTLYATTGLLCALQTAFIIYLRNSFRYERHQRQKT